jgi:uncharacterized protein
MKIETELEKLSIRHQIMFAASICERMLPFYISINFCDNFNHKTLPIIREVLDYIWNCVTINTFDREKLQKLLDTCHKITSEIEEGGLCPTPEHTAPYSLSSALELCLTENKKYLDRVLNDSFAVIDHTVNYLIDEQAYFDDYGILHGDKSAGERAEILENHYLLEREKQKEMTDYKVLLNTPAITPEFIQQFRRSADPNGCGIVDLR